MTQSWPAALQSALDSRLSSLGSLVVLIDANVHRRVSLQSAMSVHVPTCQLVACPGKHPWHHGPEWRDLCQRGHLWDLHFSLCDLGERNFRILLVNLECGVKDNKMGRLDLNPRFRKPFE